MELALERGGHLHLGLEFYGGRRTPTNVELVTEPIAEVEVARKEHAFAAKFVVRRRSLAPGFGSSSTLPDLLVEFTGWACHSAAGDSEASPDVQESRTIKDGGADGN